MRSHQNRSTHANTFIVQGNLALSQSYEPRFTVIEGGRSTEQEMTKRHLEKRSERQDAHTRSFSESVMSYLAVLLVALSLLTISCISDAIINANIASSFESVSTASITVKPGDCLLGIAESHPVPGRSAVDVANWIESFNGLDNATIYAGQTLIVPVAG